MTIRLGKNDRKKITKAQDIYPVMKNILLRSSKHDRNKEHFWVVGLKTCGTIAYIELIALGTISKTMVSPMEVFSQALQKKTERIILVHNHPSGNLIPSESDLVITRKLCFAGSFLSVTIIDHIIITEESYTSLFNVGFITAQQKLSNKLSQQLATFQLEDDEFESATAIINLEHASSADQPAAEPGFSTGKEAGMG